MIDNNDKIWKHNTAFWDQEAITQNSWSQPVTTESTSSAKHGKWSIHITKKPLMKSWLPQNIREKDILCLASAGGQQAPILAAAGANVTVFDISEKQLKQDQYVAKRDNLLIKTLQGNMTDLSAIANNSFDYIINPISNLYIPDVNPVWHECYRVLRFQGILIASFYNPILFIFDKNPALGKQGLLKPKYSIPYSDIESLDFNNYRQKIKNGEAICFGHSLTDLIDGQCKAGFMLSGFYEDEHPTPRFLIENFTPTMIATKAVKIDITNKASSN
ncbi:MAG: class I SAM-dependent methyltransferase [Legionellales bacterium]|nr:class I SAM-dependent methyltransferase [Legionellales bacterium]